MSWYHHISCWGVYWFHSIVGFSLLESGFQRYPSSNPGHIRVRQHVIFLSESLSCTTTQSELIYIYIYQNHCKSFCVQCGGVQCQWIKLGCTPVRFPSSRPHGSSHVVNWDHTTQLVCCSDWDCWNMACTNWIYCGIMWNTGLWV